VDVGSTTLVHHVLLELVAVIAQVLDCVVLAVILVLSLARAAIGDTAVALVVST